VLGDGGGAERALEHDVAALGAQRDLDRVGQDVHARDHARAGRLFEFDVFGCHGGFPLSIRGGCQFTTAMMSSSRITSSSSPSTFTVVPEYLPKSTLSPTLRSTGVSLPSSLRLPGPTASTSPWSGFSAAVSGMTMPDAVLRSSSRRLMITRSCSGRSFMFWLLMVFRWGRPRGAFAKAGSRKGRSGDRFCWAWVGAWHSSPASANNKCASPCFQGPGGVSERSLDTLIRVAPRNPPHRSATDSG